MNLNAYVSLMRPRIEQELKQVIEEETPVEAPEMKTMLTYHMGWEGEGSGLEAQGKRIRPILLLLCCAAAGGNWEYALPAGASIELLHNFSLIHDDIQDNSPLRRGRPTVWTKWGIAQAINSGDLLFTLAHLAMFKLQSTQSVAATLKASNILHDACVQLTKGQYLDLSFETRNDVDLQSYYIMIGGKTSALLGCCAELGALIAGTESATQESYREFGFTLGMAFQALDDWLGIWGDAALIGKSTESDLVSGKKTLPVLYAISQQGHFAQRWKQGKIKPDEIKDLAKIMMDEGAGEYTEKTADQLTQKALQILEKITYPDEAGNSLKELTNSLLSRKK
jgi:geranylgeranyl diphosphate synthase, type I